MPEKALELFPELVPDSGSSSPASSKNSRRRGSSSKTSRPSTAAANDGTSILSLDISDPSATAANERSFPLVTWAPLISASGCSSSDAENWPTPIVNMGRNRTAGRSNPDSTHHDGETIHDAVLTWSTPQSQDAKHQGPAGYTGQNNGSLTRDASDWSTPRAEDGERGQGSQFDGLPEDVRAWATPSTRDYKDSAGMATTGINPDGSERERVDQFPRQVFAWDGQTQRQSEAPTGPSDLSQPTPRRAGLNPRFGLWLMGFPVAWLDSAPLETRSSRKSRTSSAADSSK